MSDTEGGEPAEPFWIYGINDARMNISLTNPYSKTGKFDEDEAFNYLIKQCEFGPRNPGSEGYFKCRDFMINELKKSTDQIILQDFTHPAHPDLKFQNIIARFNSNAKFQTIISCHWDTRPIADHDLNPDNHNKPIIVDGHKRFNCEKCSEFFFIPDELECHLNLDHGMKTEKKFCTS